jgi:hypothetical protein
MKKQRRKASPAQKRTVQPAPSPKASEPARRSFLKRARNIAIGIGAVALVGGFAANSVRATIAEHDLTRIGEGIPTVVQVHDPSCNLCKTLQKETRDALDAFGEEEIRYLIADLNRSDGLSFAARHGESKVTLLLFDGDGTLRSTLRGVRTSEQLQPALEALARR